MPLALFQVLLFCYFYFNVVFDICFYILRCCFYEIWRDVKFKNIFNQWHWNSKIWLIYLWNVWNSYSACREQNGMLWVIISRSCTFIAHNLLTPTQNVPYFFRTDCEQLKCCYCFIMSNQLFLFLSCLIIGRILVLLLNFLFWINSKCGIKY